MISITFVQDQKDLALERLEKLYRNSETGMTRDRYFEMMEQLEQEPKQEEIPPDFEDLPDIFTYAVQTFNLLGDKIVPDIGYVGKDYTNLPQLIEIWEIEDKYYFLEILSWLDSRAIKKSSEQMKREREKLKRQSRGK